MLSKVARGTRDIRSTRDTRGTLGNWGTRGILGTRGIWVFVDLKNVNKNNCFVMILIDPIN